MSSPSETFTTAHANESRLAPVALSDAIQAALRFAADVAERLSRGCWVEIGDEKHLLGISTNKPAEAQEVTAKTIAAVLRDYAKSEWVYRDPPIHLERAADE